MIFLVFIEVLFYFLSINSKEYSEVINPHMISKHSLELMVTLGRIELAILELKTQYPKPLDDRANMEIFLYVENPNHFWDPR